MIRRKKTVGDWIVDEETWRFRSIGREHSSLLSSRTPLGIELSLETSFPLPPGTRCKGSATFINNNEFSSQVTVQARGKHRSLLPMFGIFIEDNKEPVIDDEYHLILRENESSLTDHPIKEMGTTTASDMFWMEWFCYRTLNLLTDCSFDCKLVEVAITLEDKFIQTDGILVESIDSLSKRIGSVYEQEEGYSLSVCDLKTLRLLELVCGNLDYSVMTKDEKLVSHNVSLHTYDNCIIPIPYDFQFNFLTATKYGPYQTFAGDDFIESAIQDIQKLYPKPEHQEPLKSLLEVIPQLNQLCRDLPLSEEIKNKRMSYNRSLATGIDHHLKKINMEN